MPIKDPFLRRLREKVIIADGAMGTMIQLADPSPDDFGGLDGCNEYLICKRPDIIRSIHTKYLEAGADLVETNTFGSARLVLAEYDIGEQAYEISKPQQHGPALFRAPSGQELNYQPLDISHLMICLSRTCPR